MRLWNLHQRPEQHTVINAARAAKVQAITTRAGIHRSSIRISSTSTPIRSFSSSVLVIDGGYVVELPVRALRRRLLLLRRLPQGVFRRAADGGSGCGRDDALLLFLVGVALLIILAVVLLLPVVVVGSYDVGQLGKIGEPCKKERKARDKMWSPGCENFSGKMRQKW